MISRDRRNSLLFFQQRKTIRNDILENLLMHLDRRCRMTKMKKKMSDLFDTMIKSANVFGPGPFLSLFFWSMIMLEVPLRAIERKTSVDVNASHSFVLFPSSSSTSFFLTLQRSRLIHSNNFRWLTGNRCSPSHSRKNNKPTATTTIIIIIINIVVLVVVAVVDLLFPLTWRQ